ncbi:UDP-N-acetylglucosamine 1-carboxyvinyltransferase [Anaeromicropila populeti]|uniref:UDP-N-acetylglucosamine 1-carboxyvinyltransferase n=1 Tax=Anaeromicropila populeti TaxID=37658 RepID=A0A1I6KWY1_9FIRM|nr:UDP-N-acetylglucosamine 1-carboxyvinyltransferase [Anaeromicropila populeti]SFR95726.1 UDP-N-acetylglucosamine 1-carboxyvinyltransferase [Anaeromicropila populeti]
MAVLRVEGGRILSGEVNVQGSKNAVLPILAACILCKDAVCIQQCPKIKDVYAMISLMQGIGCKVKWETDGLVIDAGSLNTEIIPEQEAREMRSSIIVLGAMLGRTGKVEISYPGGCSIGGRPIDIHLKSFEKMNVKMIEMDNKIRCMTEELKGSEIEFYFPSVGATENVVLAAVLAKGITIIRNAAKEPEIVELCSFLRKMGADIEGDGTDILKIKGVQSLHGVKYRVVSDRIVAGTYLAAVAGIGGELYLHANCTRQQKEVVDLLYLMGVEMQETEGGLYVKSSGRLKKIGLIRTRPYPGFPTDMQSQFMAILTKAEGVNIMVENIFEGRYKTAGELTKMGADIVIDGRAAVIRQVKKLKGTDVTAHDLRGGAALVIAAMMAEGVTTIANPHFIQRGYEDIVTSYRSLGAEISLQ